MKRVLIVGNSHTRMIRKALRDRRDAGLSMTDADMEICWVKGGSESKHGDFTPDEILKKIAGLRETDLLVLTLLGTAHNVIGMLQHDIPFALLETVDGPAAVPEDAQIIPMRSMQEYFEASAQRNGLINDFHRAAPCPVFHFSPPPPKANLALLPGRGTNSEKPDREYGSRKNLLALWKLEQWVVQNRMAEIGIGIVGMPGDVVTTEGLLQDRFSEHDVTHANAAYGELMLQEFEKLLV